MKYWWLKKYKSLKIKLIPDLTRDVNTYFIMPKHYLERFRAIRESEIDTFSEEDLRILLYTILNHEKIKNNKIILIIDRLLEIPDNFLPATNYSLEEMLEEIASLKENLPFEEKLSSNNVAACYNCLQVFYVDDIKYVNKKGLCLCPYCKNSTLYFDNDFIPMDQNFLRLAKLIYGVTPLGCNFKNLQKIIQRSIHLKKNLDCITIKPDTALFLKDKKADVVLEKEHIEFHLEEISFKKQITSKEEDSVHYIFNECFQILEKNILSKVIIDTSILQEDYTLHLSLFLFLLENLGKNPYLKEITLLYQNTNTKKIYKDILTTILNYQKKIKVN